ncbi:MAG TPA: DoxX family protein [Ktedonobacteraceae bacterium]|nr:DoxX family protein [Ktedonobacteraceae bacterium]
MAISLSTGLLILRLVAGLTLAAHGAQKLFGWFGGNGFSGTLQMQKRLGLKPAPLWAGMALLGEFGGGLSIAFGFLTPLGAAGMFGAMFMAIAKSHWKNGFWNSKRGIEFPLILLAISTAIGIIGPGNYSLDALFGINLPETLLFCILAAVALLVDVVGLVISRPVAIAPAEARSSTS